MTHTAFLVLGTDYNNFCVDLKKYVMMYGEGNTDNYFQVMNWDYKDGLRTISFAKKSLDMGNEFCSGLEDKYMTCMQDAVTIKTEEELEHFFSVLYDKTITVNNQGDSGSLYLSLLLPLYNNLLWNEAKLIMKSLDKVKQSFKVDVIGFSDDLSHLLLSEDECAQLPLIYKDYKENTKKNSKEIVAYKANCKHRFIMLQNRNSKGVSLNLNHDSFIGIMGEFALICIENYTSVFPMSEEYEQCEITAIGLSALRLDKFHFVHYLLRKAYLKVLDREYVTQKDVDVNKVSRVAQSSLESHINIVSNFYDSIVQPLIKQGKSDDEIIVEITPKLNEQISLISQNVQKFINNKDLSLPEKQAALAQLLGTDDELLKGYQFQKKQLTLDDCDSEAINLYIQENNKLIERHTDSNGEIIVTPAVLCAPNDENGNIYLPIDELKKLRSDIRESTNYIRQKNKELDEIQEQLQKNEKSEIRLTENGFTYGNTTYKLLDIEEKPLQEDYEAIEKHRQSVDLRPLFAKIKDQGQLGTCSVFSIVSIYEYILKKTKREHDLSERFVYYNVLKESGIIEDTGSSLYGVVESITKYGVCAEGLCKYDLKEYNITPSKEAYEDAATHKIKTAKNVKINHKDITSALSEGYPVTISLKIFDSFGNQSKGFVYRPTEEEIKENNYGNHAMVICGYSEEDKVYIVRNSWGKGFGDNGYCYIPFSYIEDSSLANSACIITAINEGEDIKGGGQQTVVAFNKTDLEIRYSIIRILVDEEKQLLFKNKTKYENLRINYESLIQTLCNNSKRNEIIEKATERNHKEIEKATNSYNSFINEERSKILKDFKDKNKITIYSLSALMLVLIIAWGICCVEVTDWMTNNWNLYLVGGIIFTFIMLTCFFSYKKHHYRILKDELEDRAQQMSLFINKQKRENNLLHLRLYIAGMVIDRLSNLQKELHCKYILMKSYVGNMSVWYKEELQKIEILDSSTETHYINLLSNDILNEYFSREGGKVTEDLYLYEYLNGYNLSEEGIKEYKTKIKRELIELLTKPLEDFKLFSYIQGKEYSYLNQSYSNVETLLPLLENKSDCFLQTSIKNINKRNDVSKHIFLYIDKQNEKDKWNEDFPQYFQKKPVYESIISPYKLVVFQKVNLDVDNVVDLAN